MRPPTGSKCFHLHAVLGKFGRNNRLVPAPLWLGPSLENPGSATVFVEENHTKSHQKLQLRNGFQKQNIMFAKTSAFHVNHS